MPDYYQQIARALGISRKEAKRRSFGFVYGIVPPLAHDEAKTIQTILEDHRCRPIVPSTSSSSRTRKR